MEDINADKLRQYTPRTSSLIFANGKVSKKTSAAQKNIKFSIANKKELKALIAANERQIKSGFLTLIFKDGHWKAVPPSLFEMYTDMLKYQFSKQFLYDAGVVLKEEALTPIYTIKCRSFLRGTDLEKVGRITGLVVWGVLSAGLLGITIPIEAQSLVYTGVIASGTTVFIGGMRTISELFNPSLQDHEPTPQNRLR